MTDATCRSCGAPVLFVQNAKTDAFLPLNADPDPDRGNMRLLGLSRTTGNLRAEVLGNAAAAEARAAGVTLYLSHFATCPNAKAWRKVRRESKPATPAGKANPAD